MKGGPGCYVPETKIKPDYITRKRSIVEERATVDDMTGAHPVIRDFVGVAKLPYEKKRRNKCHDPVAKDPLL